MARGEPALGPLNPYLPGPACFCPVLRGFVRKCGPPPHHPTPACLCLVHTLPKQDPPWSKDVAVTGDMAYP